MNIAYSSYWWISFALFLPAEYQLLCGNQAPGFIIDIHTGKPIGNVNAKSILADIHLFIIWTSEIFNYVPVFFLQILMNVGRSQGSVPLECVSTRSGASAANVRWASATTTYYWFAKVGLNWQKYSVLWNSYLCAKSQQLMHTQLESYIIVHTYINTATGSLAERNFYKQSTQWS